MNPYGYDDVQGIREEIKRYSKGGALMVRSIALLVVAGGAIVSLLLAKPAAAAGLYPTDSSGIWGPDSLCDHEAWSRTYILGYVMNDQLDYFFDIPDPVLIIGETVSVSLTPTVVGTLPGTVDIAGATTITGRIDPPDAFGGLFDAADAFTLSFTPGEPTVGSLPAPAGWHHPAGWAAVTATISGTESGEQTIVMLAQPFVDAEVYCPEPTVPSPSPNPDPALPTAQPDPVAVTPPATDVDLARAGMTTTAASWLLGAPLIGAALLLASTWYLKRRAQRRK